jgi:hypothetical protein
MRSLFAALFLAVLVGIPGALAERRVFIIANNAEGYGVDRCLATGAPCGAAAATALCRARDFSIAISFRKVEKSEITGGAPVSSRDCPGGVCEHFVAIECTR